MGNSVPGVAQVRRTLPSRHERAAWRTFLESVGHVEPSDSTGFNDRFVV
jgi:hypothetical protein